MHLKTHAESTHINTLVLVIEPKMLQKPRYMKNLKNILRHENATLKIWETYNLEPVVNYVTVHQAYENTKNFLYLFFIFIIQNTLKFQPKKYLKIDSCIMVKNI